jgi:hypothetical protein
MERIDGDDWQQWEIPDRTKDAEQLFLNNSMHGTKE